MMVIAQSDSDIILEYYNYNNHHSKQLPVPKVPNTQIVPKLPELKFWLYDTTQMLLLSTLGFKPELLDNLSADRVTN